MTFSAFVDTLASIAAIVAIVTAMVGWRRSARKPLTIKRVVIHNKENAATFILMAKNVQSNPVTISRVGCYTQKSHIVQRRQGGKPEYSETYSSNEMVFDAPLEFEVAANGYTDVRIEVNKPQVEHRSFLFLLRTSHGFHELWCKDITIVEIGKSEAYSLDYQHTFASAWQAKPVYILKNIMRIFGM